MLINVLKSTQLKMKSLITFIAIVSAVALPQLFHAIGIISDTGNLLGATFLPMHIPVLIAALIGGPIVGLISGAISPIISFAISGMPALTLLPFMVIELTVYGLVGGMIYKVNTPTIVKLLIIQLAGRAARSFAVIIAVYGFNSEIVELSSIYTSFTTSLPGIVLQWALIPLIIYRINGMKK